MKFVRTCVVTHEKPLQCTRHPVPVCLHTISKRLNSSCGKWISTESNETAIITTAHRLRGDPNVKEQFSEIIDTWSVGKIVHRNGDFSVGALMRILPGFITYFVLGSSFADPRNLTLVFMSFFVDILVAKWMKVRKKNGEG